MARILLVEDSDALPDVVITDLNMPDMDGIEVILGVQARLPLVPIIAISGGGLLPPELLLDIATALGACYDVAKPFTPDKPGNGSDGPGRRVGGVVPSRVSPDLRPYGA